MALFVVPLFIIGFRQPAQAAPSTYLNFQGRLKTSSGPLVPDGTYNLEFKLYDTATDGTGTNLWTETRTGADRVRVVNGYFSVSLGSVTAFPGTIDWSEQHWITMNVGGTGTPSWDGEMTNSGARMILTAVPYAFQASTSNATRGVVSDTADPSGSIGGIYYNTTSGSFRCYEGGTWQDCISAIGGLTNMLADNTADAWDIEEGSNNYLNIDTTDSSEAISFGNTNTDPDFSFLGSGTLTVSGSAAVTGALSTSSSLSVSGGAVIGGQTRVTSLAVPALTSGAGAFNIGSVSGTHIAFGGNDIQAKSNATTAGTLDLNPLGGTVTIATLGSADTSTTLCRNSSNEISTCLGGGITGSGTTDYVARFTGANTVGIGVLYDDGTNVGVGTTDPEQIGASFTYPSSGLSAARVLNVTGTGDQRARLVLQSGATASGGGGGIQFYSSMAAADEKWYALNQLVDGDLAVQTLEDDGTFGSTHLQMDRTTGNLMLGAGGTSTTKLYVNNDSVSSSGGIYVANTNSGNTANAVTVRNYSGEGIVIHPYDSASRAAISVRDSAGGYVAEWRMSGEFRASDSGIGHSFLSDSDTGLGRSGTNQITLYTANADRLTINSSGNVGVGTSTFSGLFNVGTVNSANQYAYLDGLRIGGEDPNNTIWNDGRSITMSADSGQTISLCRTSACATAGLVFNTTSGDVSIDGSAGAYGFLDNTTGDKIRLYSNTYGLGIESSTLTSWSGSQFRWRTGGSSVSTGTERMLLTTSGLDIAGTVAAGGTGTIGGVLHANGGIQVDGATVIDNGAGWHRAHGATGFFLQDYGVGFRANASGIIETYGSGDLDVNGGDVYVRATGTSEATNGTSGNYTRIHHNGSDGYIDYTGGSLYFRSASSGTRMTLNANVILNAPLYNDHQYTVNNNVGTVCWDSLTASGLDLYGRCISLRSHKKNIADLDMGLETIRQLQPRAFDWKQSGMADFGFIAEEVEAVDPRLAEYSDGELTGVHYLHMSALSINAAKQLDVQVQNHDSMFGSINARLAVLEAGQLPQLQVAGNASIGGKLTVGGKIIAGGEVVLGSKTDEPAGVNGAMYYNSAMRKFRCFQDGAWMDCISPAFREFVVCAPGNSDIGICDSFTDLGAAFTEVSNSASRNVLDLSGFSQFRIIAQLSTGAVAGDVRIECDTDQGFISPAGLGTLENPGATLNVGGWQALPAGECKTAGGAFIRAGMMNGDASEDPVITSIRLQVR